MNALLDSDWFWIGIVLLGVLAFNVGLIHSLRSGRLGRQLNILRRAARQARNPWRSEDEALADLRDRVSRLTAQSEETSDDG